MGVKSETPVLIGSGGLVRAEGRRNVIDDVRIVHDDTCMYMQISLDDPII